MTDWLEELLDRVEEMEDAETSMEFLTLNLPGGQGREYASQDRRQDGTTQTTGQEEALPEERTGGAAFETDRSPFGRTVPENGTKETSRTSGGSDAASGWDREKRADGMTPEDILWRRERRQTPEAELYQRLTRAGWERSGSRPVGQSVVVERQSVGTPSLTVDQLDRAVRRDSRRYDGGMELY